MDILDDVKEFFDQQHAKWWERYKALRLEDIVLPLQGAGATKALDGSGNGTLHLYRNSTGRTLIVGRLTLNCAVPNGTVYTPATVFQSSTCYAYLHTGETFPGPSSAFDFLPDSPGGQVFPQIAEYSSRNALRLGKNEVLSMTFFNGPANGVVSSSTWGELLPIKYAEMVV